MARIRAEDVNTVRAVVTWVLRAIAAAALAIGVYLPLKALLLGLSVGNMEMAYSVYDNVGENHPLSRGLVLITLGAALGLFSSKIARWMIPVPGRGCPGCGYAGPGRNGLCPECGLRIEGD